MVELGSGPVGPVVGAVVDDMVNDASGFKM